MAETLHLFLTGFMGAGKSTVSRVLSRTTGIYELDTDRFIVMNEGMPISEIFEKYGESYFRSLETSLLRGILSTGPRIVSCGGGMVLKDDNVRLMHRAGTVVLLTAEPETIFERVKNSANRPILNGHMNVEYIKELMSARLPFYEAAADIKVATDLRSIEDIVEEIIRKTGIGT
ncbi:MAG: shikimate kinase [Lachnospiraceae bacterium]|jgi:shikimate kinase|nr:shikimate kinase [Lachnospiraceae bacterium]MEE3461011.1 shikimate kinase [Lachnospiraceae bacterium]